jgi:type I restriction enzyme, S subunit
MKAKAYRKYKTSGVEWLGVVPEHWEVKRLKFIGTALIGITYSPEDIVDEDFNGNKYLVLRSTNIQEGKISLHENVYVTTKISTEMRVRKWDILICARNGSRHLVGKNALINEDDDKMTFGAFTTIYRSKINPFLFYFFSSDQFKYQSTGFLTTTINQLTNDNLNNIVSTLPPVSERQAIVSFLGRETGRIDTLIEKKQRLIELLKEKGTAVISRAVTKGLNPAVKMKPSGIEWLGEVPEHWEIKKLKYVCQIIDGDRGKEYPNDSDFLDEGEIPFLSSKNLINNKIDYTEMKFISREKYGKLGRGKLNTGDLIVTVRGTIGNTALFDGDEFKTGFINAQMMILRHTNKLESVFLWYFSKSIVWTTQLDFLAYGTAQQQLSNEILASLIIPIPPLPEQHLIASFLDRETSRLYSLISKVESAILKLKEYRTAIISAAVTGKIDVSTSLNAGVREAE